MVSRAPVVEIDPIAFHADPYPVLAELRQRAPIACIAQLGATVFARRDDIFVCEKNVEVFSSDQPDGLMTVLMGQNMMRKDGDAHMQERRPFMNAVSPRVVREHWLARFRSDTLDLLDTLAASDTDTIDLVRDYALPVSANALRAVTGLETLTPLEMDAVSQAMIDGIANYAGDAEVTERCHAATHRIDEAIDAQRQINREAGTSADAAAAAPSILSVLDSAGLPDAAVRANIRLAISGGQNEPRDAIAGCVHALLLHPGQRALITSGEATWLQAFEEYCRWMSPIGMSPRRVARAHHYHGVDFVADERVFFLFGSANRDEAHFTEPDAFDITRDRRASIPFGAGPHFCAGAFVSRALVADVALPMLFERFPALGLSSPDAVTYAGWAFRGPTVVPVRTGH